MPSDPFTYSVPNTNQRITFSNYARTLNQRDVNAALLQAANTIIAQLSTSGDGVITAVQISAASVHVRLILRPNPRMTWTMWGCALQGITNFLNFFEFVEFQFTVYDAHFLGPVGRGNLLFSPR